VVERFGDRCAFAGERGALTYRQLDVRANVLAHELLARISGRDQTVGLLLEQGVELVSSLLATLKAGHCYVPLDPQLPLQRLERLEEIAGAREGVDKVFAMQAGREIRVMVAPEVVDDIEAQVLARDIAKQIEEELTYPGQIKVTVVRESRATETAR